MNAIALQIDRSTRAIRPVHPMWNLLRKEWRESRGALIAGLIIFAAVPLIWNLVYILIDGFREPGAPFGLGLLALTGWLYALSIGAHTVCRDWGQAEEHFLLARPVSARAVIAAKLIAGLATLILVWLAAGTADVLAFILPLVAARPDSFQAEEFLVVIPMATLLFVAFVLAFAAAVLTRRTLTATLLAGLVLFIWVGAPLVWQPLRFLHPDFQQTVYTDGVAIHPSIPAMLGGWPFFLLVVICMLAAVALALAGSRQERKVRLGYKPLAWAIALVVLGLFVAATTEVGNSMVVLDTAVIPRSEDGGRVSDWQFASDGDRCFGMATFGSFRPEGWGTFSKELSDRQIVSFSVGDSGQIQDLRHATLWFHSNPAKPPSHPYAQPAELIRRQQVFQVWFPEPDSVILVGLEYGYYAQLFRMRISWPPGHQPTVLSREVAVLPNSVDRPLLLRFAAAEQYALAEYAFADVETRTKLPSVLGLPGMRRVAAYRFDWSNGADGQTKVLPTTKYDLESEEYNQLISSSSADTPLVWQTAVLEHGRKGLYARGYTPEPAGEKPDWSWRFAIGGGAGQVAAGLGRAQWRAYYGYGADWLPLGRYAFYADNLGVQVFDRKKSGEDRLIGEYVASPLSAILHAQERAPQLLNGGRLADLTARSLAVYDISDPARPTQVGFYNLALNADRGQVFIVGQHIIVRQLLWWPEQDQLTVLAPPPR